MGIVLAPLHNLTSSPLHDFGLLNINWTHLIIFTRSDKMREKEKQPEADVTMHKGLPCDRQVRRYVSIVTIN